MPLDNDQSAIRRKVSANGYVEISAEWRRFTGRSSEGDGWKPLVHPEDVERVARDWEIAQKTGRFFSEYRVIAKDGEYRRILFVALRVQRCGTDPRWYGKITEIAADHRHVCTTDFCFCGLRRP